MIRALFVVFALLLASYMLAGCGAAPPQIAGAVIAGGIDVASCAPDDYAQFKAAAQLGGLSWAAAFIDLIQCAGKVYTDVNGALQHALKLRPGVDAVAFVLGLPPEAGDAALMLLDTVAAADDDQQVAVLGDHWSRRGLKRLAKAKRLYDVIFKGK